METVLRVVIIYLFLLFGLRIMGKREFSQLSSLELVTLLMIPELVSQSLVQEDFSLTNALIAVSTLFTVVFISTLLQYHSKTVSKVVSGSPAVVVADGKFVEKHLNEERVSPEEIFAELHKAGFSELSEVQWAILETDGTIAIVPNDQGSGASPKKSRKQKKAL